MRRPAWGVRAAVGTTVMVVACGGSPPTGPGPSPGPAVLSVGGQYRIDQQGVTDTCNQGTQIPSVNGTVTHTPSSFTFTMSDTGGTNFSGTVENNGNFVANAVFGPDSGGQTFTPALAGAVYRDRVHGSACRRRPAQELQLHAQLDGHQAGLPEYVPLTPAD